MATKRIKIQPVTGKAEAEAIIDEIARLEIARQKSEADLKAAIQAVEAVDAGLARVVQAVKAAGGSALITADHGNADQMLAEDGVSPFTAHTTARVPLILASDDASLGLDAREDARLADIAPTLADLLGIEKPSEWTGNSLLTRV